MDAVAASQAEEEIDRTGDIKRLEVEAVNAAEARTFYSGANANLNARRASTASFRKFQMVWSWRRRLASTTYCHGSVGREV